jgi:putative hydrolase of the HAD superfamily
MHFNNLFFDLDDTLYPASSGLWDAIRQRMNEYMQGIIDLPMPEIVTLRKNYLDEYGTTLRGLQAHFNVDADEYLRFVHDIPLEKYVRPDPALHELLLGLPQKRWIFTNADVNHANRVLKILGISDCFTGIIDIRAMDFACKPDKIAYQRALELTCTDNPSYCVLFDDSLRNLTTAREMGFVTVLVGKNGQEASVHRTISSLHDLKVNFPELWVR